MEKELNSLQSKLLQKDDVIRDLTENLAEVGRQKAGIESELT